MRILLICTFCIALCAADSASNSQETKTKSSSKTTNAIPTSPKQEQYYVPQVQLQQQTPQYLPFQFLAKHQPQFYSQPQPAMIIIAAAQPTSVVPQQPQVYGGAAQQLLSYFHNNPQARYQFLHGYQPQPTAQPYLAAPQGILGGPQSVLGGAQGVYAGPQGVVGAPTYSNYQYVPAPQYQQLVPAAPPQYAYAAQEPMAVVRAPPHPATQQPLQLGQIAHLAQMTAQQISSGQIRTAPAIITGLENFTPDQQAQIKAQLGSHLGNAISSNQDQIQPLKYTSTTPVQTTNDFVPSPEVKTVAENGVGSYNASPTEMYKTQAYSKG